MKHFLVVLLCLLLCGCTPTPSENTQTPPETLPPRVSMYDPGHSVEQAYPGEIRAYPLTMRKVHGLLPFGKNLLTLSGYGSTTLTLLTGEELWLDAQVTLGFDLRQEDPSLQLHAEAISFFDPIARETVVLDHILQEVRRIAAPGNLSGVPLLSEDQNTLYYCTSWAVMAWDLDSGIRRPLRELSFESQEISGLHRNGTVVECTIRDSGEEKLLFLSTYNGMELDTLSAGASVVSAEARYFAAIPAGNMTLLIFGHEDSSPRMLLPEQFPNQQYYLPEDHALITSRSTEEGIALDYYELNTGILRASFSPEPLQTPKSIVNCKGHSLYILSYDPAADCDILYRWDVLRKSPEAGNTADHTFPYYPEEAPDSASLALCREYADAIGEKYGISVRIGEDALQVQPWDYRFTAEHLAPVLQRELKNLEHQLSQYPEAVLRQTAGHFSNLTVSFVREITGTQEAGSLSKATGIQFFLDGEAHVVIATGQYAYQALYHELYHVMETHILAESSALDTWEQLNPGGFVYGVQPEGDIYLRGEIRAFVDSYSMGYAKEDRARIFEYAMLRDNEALFHGEYMQRKLNAVCTAIREAYRLKKVTDILPWEQYLATPLGP